MLAEREKGKKVKCLSCGFISSGILPFKVGRLLANLHRQFRYFLSFIFYLDLDACTFQVCEVRYLHYHHHSTLHQALSKPFPSSPNPRGPPTSAPLPGCQGLPGVVSLADSKASTLFFSLSLSTRTCSAVPLLSFLAPGRVLYRRYSSGLDEMLFGSQLLSPLGRIQDPSWMDIDRSISCILLAS